MNFPEIDVIIATKNSEKWIEPCFVAISNLNYPLEKLKIIVYDNSSDDRTVEVLKSVLARLSLNNIIIEGKTNLGFGVANNLAAAQGSAPFIFCLNIDTEIEKDCLINSVKV